MITIIYEIKVENGAFSWDFDPPANNIDNFIRSPIAFHDASQIAVTPFFEESHYAIKFNNF